MGKLLVAVCVLVGAVTLAVPAHADGVGFVSDLARVGIAAGDNDDPHTLISIGDAVCTSLINRQPPDTVAENLYRAGSQSGVQITMLQAKEFVVYAVADLCPGAAAIATGN